MKEDKIELPMWFRFPLSFLSLLVVNLLAFKFLPMLGIGTFEIFIASIPATAIFGYLVIYHPALFGWRKSEDALPKND